MAFEKRWASVPVTAFVADGTQEGLVTVLDSTAFFVKQRVKIGSNTQGTSNFEIKRIIGNLIFVGPQNTNLRTKSDLSAYLVADSAFISAEEQPRPNIPPDDVWRAVYEEEPTVAIRSHLVDEYGDPYTTDNPLAVDAVLNLDSIDFPTAATPTIQNITVPTADTEQSVAIPAGSKGFRAKLRSQNNNPPGRLQIAFQAGQSNIAYLTVSPGAWYIPPAELDTNAGLTMYFRSSKDQQVLEIESWS